MIVKIITVLPSVITVKSGERQFEIPAEAFPSVPRVGQTWELGINHVATAAEQAAKLNDYLASA